MKIDKVAYAAVDEDGVVWSNGADEAFGALEDVQFVIDTGREIKDAFKSGKIKIVKVKLVEIK